VDRDQTRGGAPARSRTIHHVLGWSKTKVMIQLQTG
jgi:hypothetical protein